MESTDLKEKDISTKTAITKNHIDLRTILAHRNPTLSMWIPDFALYLLKKLLALDKVNGSVYRHQDKVGILFARAVVIEDIGIKIKIENPENIPTGKRPLIAANHPLGGVDGMALISVVGEKQPNILFPVNDLLLYLPELKPIFVPINKFGKNTQNQSKLEEAFASDSALLYFPAGLCSRKQKGEIMDLDWKKTFLRKAIDYKRDIYPVYVDARNSNFFYNFSNFRKKLGIKANIESIFLPHEMYKQKGKTIRLIFGEPIPYTIFDKSKTDIGWTELIKKHVYKLKTDVHARFNEQ